ncbi:MAG TPA: response regulator [Bryobacteraceae bacterium]|nr:response regulator [Bryobacteraceae bacterium]
MDGCIPKVPILVVDDDLDYRILARHQLEAAGYQVLDSAGGNSAVAILEEQCFRLVILDIVMPDIEGLEIIRRLQRQGCRSKILAVSGAGLADTYLRLAVQLGADAKFDKIRPVGDLLVAVEGLIGHSSPPCNETPPQSD